MSRRSVTTMKVYYHIRNFAASLHRHNNNLKTSCTLKRNYSLKPYTAHEHSLVRNYEDSFQLWVLNRFKNNSNYTTLLSLDEQKCCKSSQTPSEGNSSGVESILNELISEKANQTLTPFKLRSLDNALCSKISNKSSVSHLLGCLNVCMSSVPVQSTKLSAFRAALLQLEARVKRNGVSTHDIVQAMYYASHFKSSTIAKTFMSVATVKLDEKALNELSTVDLGIFCLSMFRSSFPLTKPRFLDVIANRVKDDIESLLRDHPAVFVSLIKCLRISNYYDENMVDFLASQGLNSLGQLDVVAKIHLGVYFAVSRYANVDFVTKYLTTCVNELSSRVDDRIHPRLKDFDNLLWASGTYNLSRVNRTIENSSVPSYIKESLGTIRKDPHSQIALLLWLWICSCRLEDDVVRWVTLENAKFIAGSKNFKSVANLFLLLTCVQVEAQNLLKPQIVNVRDKRLQPNYEQYIARRPRLKRLLKLVVDKGSGLRLENARFSFEVPGLYIGGVSAQFRGKPISFEVIDETVTLTNSSELSGRMKLKLRLLEKMGHRVIQVPGESIDESTLGNYLSE